MKTKKEIVEILLEELDSVYCHNCGSNELEDDDENYCCDECYRKYMKGCKNEI